MILRPSIVFGPEDQFFNRFAGMARFGPILPILGARKKFQPVFVDDVALAAVKGITGETAPGVYELGGPEVDTFEGLMRQMLAVIRRRRIVIGMPFWAGRALATVFSLANRITLGLTPQPVTRDQVRSLAYDNVVAERAKGFAELGIVPTSTEAILPTYLWRFRPSGQYAAIKESARNLRP
jgi:NADH dehydrogenase